VSCSCKAKGGPFAIDVVHLPGDEDDDGEQDYRAIRRLLGGGFEQVCALTIEDGEVVLGADIFGDWISAMVNDNGVPGAPVTLTSAQRTLRARLAAQTRHSRTSGPRGHQGSV
jgi:hypothetical protein